MSQGATRQSIKLWLQGQMKDYTMLNSEQFFFFSKYITYILEFFRFWFEVMVAKMLIFQNLKSKC